MTFVLIGELHKVRAATIRLSSKSFTLAVNHYKTLHVYGTSKTVKWTSSNKSIAAVSSGGRVTAKAPGTVTITASVSGKRLSAKVTVIKLNASTATLAVGSTKTLKVYGTSSTVKWSTSNKAVATVSSSGKVTAKAPGKATVYATVLGKKLESRITVTKPVTKPATKPVTNTDQPKTEIYNQVQTPPKKIVGYYAAWSRYSGFSPLKLDAGKLTHINYAFANIGSDLRIALGYPDIDSANIKELNQLKITNPNLKTLIAVGGWSWSGRFSDVALTEASRSSFADSVVDFIVQYGFDGVDIDWEYPVSGGLDTNTRRPEDKYHFTLLLEILREKLDERGKKNGKKYLLSFAGAAGSWYLKNTEISKISQLVDYANLMTYDIHGIWEPNTNFNAPLYHSDTEQPYGISVASSVQEWLKAGFSKDKLVMGVPFYGFVYKSVSPVNNGLFQTYSGGASISYANIAANYLKQEGFVRYYDPLARVPWLFDGSTFITYEDEQSIAEKAGYVKNSSLGGAMIWELSQDPNKVLLSSLYQVLK